MFELTPNLPLPTKDYILSKISDYQIFKHYFPQYNPGGGATHSPLRGNDNIPSFAIFYAERNRMLMFKDFATKEAGDCFQFVAKLYNLSFPEALYKICSDFGLRDVYIPDGYKSISKPVPKVSVDYSTINKVISIRVKTKPFTKEELDWWWSFGISETTLKRYKVFSLSKIFINSHIVTPKFSFGYLEAKDGVYTWKIYSPLDTEHKWINNCSSDVLQGFAQLPPTGDVLIIEKAIKDSMPIVEHTEYHSFSVQNEGVIIKPTVMADLRRRFKKIYYLGDNDERGIEFSGTICEKNQLIPIFIPCTKYKNFSDLIKGTGDIDYSVKILHKLVRNHSN